MLQVLTDMAKKVFFSFDYANDGSRVSELRNIGGIEVQQILSGNEWEEKIKRRGDKTIQAWIDEQMKHKSCVVVLIGSNTAARKWVKYEITHGWQTGKGVLGIYIHNLKDSSGHQYSKGRNPFDDFTIGDNKMSSVVKSYDPPYANSTDVYDCIQNNVESWVEEAISIRNANS